MPYFKKTRFKWHHVLETYLSKGNFFHPQSFWRRKVAKTYFTFNFNPASSSFVFASFPFYLHPSSHSLHSTFLCRFKVAFKDHIQTYHLVLIRLLKRLEGREKNEKKTNIIHKLHFTHIIIMLFNIWCLESMLKRDEGWQMESIKHFIEFRLLRRYFFRYFLSHMATQTKSNSSLLSTPSKFPFKTIRNGTKNIKIFY